MSQPGTARVTKRGGIYHRSCSTLVQRTHGFYPKCDNGVGPEAGEFHSETALLVHYKDGLRDSKFFTYNNKYLMTTIITIDLMLGFPKVGDSP